MVTDSIFKQRVSAATPPRSRRVFCARFGLLVSPSSFGGRRECRAPDAPDSRVCNGSCEMRTRVSQVTPEIARHSPRNGLRLIARSPRRPAFLPPSLLRSLLPRNLMPASGHQDHTPSPSASVPFVKGTSASTASRPAFVTIAKRPSEWDGTAADIDLIWVFGKSEYFCKRG